MGEHSNDKADEESAPPPAEYGRGRDVAQDTANVLLFNKDGNPAFQDYWPKDTPREEMRTLHVSIASSLPDFLQPQSDAFRFMEHNMFRDYGNTADSAGAIDARTLKIFRDYAGEFEKTYGVHLDIQADNPHAQLTLLSVDVPRTNARAQAVSSIPAGADHFGFAAEPARLSPDMKLKQGVIVFNEAFMATSTDAEVRNTIRHEMLHYLGIPDIGDLPEHKMPYSPLDMDMNSRDALSMASYGWREGKQFTPTGEQLDLGALELGLRHYMPNPAPDINPGDVTYDLGRLESRNRETNAAVDTPRMTALSIIAGSGHNTIKTGGEASRSFVDTNPGYCGEDVYTSPGKPAVLQDVCLLEGHIDAVDATKGNNRILLDEGTQSVVFGAGRNIAQILSPKIGEKRIDGENYTLALDDSVIKSTRMKVQQQGGNLLLDFEGDNGRGGSVSLGGNASGMQELVITHAGRPVYTIDTHGLAAGELSRKVSLIAAELDGPQDANAPTTPDVKASGFSPSSVPDAPKSRVKAR